MAGYNPNNPFGSEQPNLLHALFPPRGASDQQMPVGGPHGIRQNYAQGFGQSQGNLAYGQFRSHDYQQTSDPRSVSTSGVASPAINHPPVYRSISGSPGQTNATMGAQNSSAANANHKTNLLFLLNQKSKSDLASPNIAPLAVNNGQSDVQSPPACGSENQKSSAPPVATPHAASRHVTADSLLALLNTPKAATQTMTDTGNGADNDSAADQRDVSASKTGSNANGSAAIQALLGIMSRDTPNTTNQPAKDSPKSAAEEAAEAFDATAEKVGKVAVDVAEKSSDTADDREAEKSDLRRRADAGEVSQPSSTGIASEPSPSTSGPAATKVEAPVAANDAVEDIADSWENIADEAANGDEGEDNTETVVDVYDFEKLKPFISITINKEFETELTTFSTDEDSTLAIARLKKAFDQNDRTLVTATQNFIIFAMSKKGGVRIVNQSDGRNKSIFEETQDQIFNVASCISKDNGTETVVASGCSGTVYWFMNRDAGGEGIDEFTPHYSFALPPIQSPGDENPGGVLKTRARKSANHTEFFGVGRGKSIHIIFPSIITGGKFYKPGTVRTVDVEKYLAHKTLKIDTGKAAKDFTFSQDDTTVVSLDKAGRIKFWDIRGLTSDDAKSVVLRDPLMTLITTPANEKSWPTSVIFVDKKRRFEKNGSMRYLLVGMKQNHTLQLWDLALRRMVQELCLPHDKDSDAACSVVFHAASGTVVVGHPTRNSVYFIQLSLPKASPQGRMSQAEYVQLIARHGVVLPTSSAAFANICEYSFSQGVKPEAGSDKRARGDLRSLDILQKPANVNDKTAIFELYTMHSTGVTSMTIRAETLGRDADHQLIKSINAYDIGLATAVDVQNIEQPAPGDIEPSTPSTTNPPSSANVTPQVKEILRKPASVSSNAATDPVPVQSPTPPKRADSVKMVVNGSTESSQSSAEKSEKRKKRRSSALRTSENASDVASSSKPLQVISEASFESSVKPAEAVNINFLKRSILQDLQSEFKKVRQTFTDYTAADKEKQVELLQIASKSMSENVDTQLSKIVETNSRNVLVPALTASLSSTIQKCVDEAIKAQLGNAVQSSVAKEVQTTLPVAITKAFSSPQFFKQMTSLMQQLGLASESMQQSNNELLRTMNKGFDEMQLQRKADVDKIEYLLKQRDSDNLKIDSMVKQRQADGENIQKLETVVHQLGELISGMASAQEKSRQSSVERENKLVGIIEQSNSLHAAVVAAAQAQASAPAGQTSKAVVEAPAPVQSVEDDIEAVVEAIIMDMRAAMDHFNKRRDADGKHRLEEGLNKWLTTGGGQLDQVLWEAAVVKSAPQNIMFQVDDPVYLLLTMKSIASKLPSISFRERVLWLDAALNRALTLDFRNMDPVSTTTVHQALNNSS